MMVGNLSLKRRNYSKKISLPHTWNAEDAQDDETGYYRGGGKYKKELDLNLLEGQKAFLYFEGANQITNLFFNGDSIGKHVGGYTSFAFDISNSLQKGTNKIEIDIKNDHDSDIPPLSMDYTFYGGIYRDVYFIVTNPIHFDVLNSGSSGVKISTPDVSVKKGKFLIQAQLLNDTNVEQEINLVHRIISPSGQEIETLTKKVELVANSGPTKIGMDGIVKSPELWSPESPSLYTVVSEIRDSATGKVMDQIVNPLGFRWFSMDPQKGFFLNGKHLKLIGVSRHQDYWGYG